MHIYILLGEKTMTVTAMLVDVSMMLSISTMIGCMAYTEYRTKGKAACVLVGLAIFIAIMATARLFFY